MAKSMTGFGRAELAEAPYNLVIEMKSVNNRYNDIIIKLPKALKSLEEVAKKLIKEDIKRGRVEVFVNYEQDEAVGLEFKPNLEIAKKYYAAIEKIAQELELEEKPNLDMIINYPDLISVEKEEANAEILEKLFLKGISNATKELVAMREQEGEALCQDLIARKRILEDYLEQIIGRTPELVLEHKKKLKERIEELLSDESNFDESKFANEVAYFADKSNITEEIVRLRSHFDQLESILLEEGSIGRKLDFLIQEMNREINTIGSKVQDLEVTTCVIEIKSELEKIREQVQNIE
ncbi:MAG: YicC family protein [Tissierellales bacterium]|jgi:uncharacterized protein (TIGR00255 family)|nr:YicC family protein [Tissierellales bacterium]